MVKKTLKSKDTAHYIPSIGRRKTALARVRIYPGKRPKEHLDLVINGKPFTSYFPLRKLQDIVTAPLRVLSLKDCQATIKVSGGGINAQAEAIRLGLSRALVAENPLSRPKLKPLGFLKRDPRMVERKKFGSRKARRPQQWRKR